MIKEAVGVDLGNSVSTTLSLRSIPTDSFVVIIFLFFPSFLLSIFHLPPMAAPRLTGSRSKGTAVQDIYISIRAIELFTLSVTL